MATSDPRDNDPRRSSSAPDLRRLTCARCGANNFPSSLTCWQCGTPQNGARISGSGPPPPDTRQALSPEWLPQAAPGQEPPIYSPNNYMPREPVDPSVADRAAAFLGLFLPFAGLPVGIVFLMFDDARKARLGWIAIIWSTIGTLASVILSIMAMVPAMSVLKGLMPHGGAGAPGMPNIPGLPSGNGIPDIQTWLVFCMGLIR